LPLEYEASRLYEERQLSKLEETLETSFRDKSLLIKALSHRSPSGSQLTSKDENKRLGNYLQTYFAFSIVALYLWSKRT
jgi:dsRNA-specific ribonuclease